MPKKTKGGGQIRKNIKRDIDLETKSVLKLKKKDEISKDNNNKEKVIKSDECYAQVIKRLGGRIVEVIDEFKNKRKCVICGKFMKGKKKQWINPNDIVIINYEINHGPDKDGFLAGEVFHKYCKNDIIKLENIGELDPEVFNLNEKIIEIDCFDWEYIEEETAEELEQKKIQKRKNEPYFDYNTIESDSDEELNNVKNNFKKNNINYNKNVDEETKIDIDDI